ncbi:hypothetical protein EDC56_3845 [Sinobacterium caligoides]|uniref:Uncharacterized protein n=1 Tax=Sinobacterium caligoides TaxID=933926 RepID=A0A3N2D507_9GAMM|nr:hypothetical protein [Sinobacterium caligoides]ROR94860.1 hypothetical protein EDC56_3845 [Sinobacterium caligoides]
MYKILLSVAISALISTGAFAAKPTSIAFESKNSTSEQVEYSNYVVKCSNGKRQPLTAWDNRKKWCVGQGSQENCHKRQMKAAKAACKLQ